jgi:hypothetical protein
MAEVAESVPGSAHRKEVGIWSGRFAGGIVSLVFVWYLVMWFGLALYTDFNWPRVIIAASAAGAAGAVGGIVGFLFGIPRARSEASIVEVGATRAFLPNTNLEQISDWLTKTIVGVGLVQFREIWTALQGVAGAVGKAIGDLPNLPGSAMILAMSTLIASGIAVFAAAYMWTMTRLYEVYSSAD